MHQLQVLELILWGFLTPGLKPGMSLDQGMRKVEKWNGTTVGSLIRGLKSQQHWPCGTTDQLELAVEIRNYLAHHFLREYFAVLPSEEVRETASQWLADVSVWLEHLEEQLDGHLRSLGVPRYEDIADDVVTEVDKLRPTKWMVPGS